jgi:hypothetical protein
LNSELRRVKQSFKAAKQSSWTRKKVR